MRTWKLIAWAVLAAAWTSPLTGAAATQPAAQPATQPATAPVVDLGRTNRLLLVVSDVPEGGMALGEIPIPVEWRGMDGNAPGEFDARAVLAGKAVPVALIPPIDDEAVNWLVVLKLPRGGPCEVDLTLTSCARKSRPTSHVEAVCGPGATVGHDAAHMGGLPRYVRFGRNGRIFDTFRWNDRLYDPAVGPRMLRYCPRADLRVLTRGGLVDAVRTRCDYSSPDGNQPESWPAATYDWIYFRDLPLAYVRATVDEIKPKQWSELHFLELNWPGEQFSRWAGGEPNQAGRLAGAKRTFTLGDWALVRDGNDAIGMLRGGRLMFYDGRGGYGTYLHAASDQAWQGWSGRPKTFSAWMWIGQSDDPVASVRRCLRSLPTEAHILATPPVLHGRIATARKGATMASRELVRRTRIMDAVLAEKYEALGLWDEAAQCLDANSHTERLVGGDLAVATETFPGGAGVAALVDLTSGEDLSAVLPEPLFTITMRNTSSGEIIAMDADSNWQTVRQSASPGQLTINWSDANEPSLAGLGVVVTCRPVEPSPAAQAAAPGGLAWRIRVKNPCPGWAVWDVKFPRLTLRPMGGDTRVLVPQGCGVLKRDIWRSALQYKGTYPGGWTAMQFLAAYDQAKRTGLYVADCDPNASVKEIAAETDQTRRRLIISWGHSPAGMTTPAQDFVLSAPVEWRPLRGDWFDASMVYRDWVRRSAKWQPKLGPDGRQDTPMWMRELCLWAQVKGDPDTAASEAAAFVNAIGLPTGVHWYRWHKIPFDNDYPHYLPAREGFAKAVAQIQDRLAKPAYVMPYINGRLWDTRDRGTADFEFSRLALPAAAKDVDGNTYVETYGSKESDGSPVRLAPMCPSTPLWQRTITDLVLRLMDDDGVRAVYVDQVAAARPRLCFDPNHDHPAGGGSWWVESYGRMLSELRRKMPVGDALTTECNAEPYMKWFDGYLTWHWQFDGQVPAFPAVYGGAIQMFGRAYRGGPTKDLALRMKAGQQLVFGEQIGWIDPGVVSEPANVAFLKQMAHVRHQLRRFFYAGQMARPPALRGTVPTVTADWQWNGPWPVTTDAVLTGAWELPGPGAATVSASSPAAGANTNGRKLTLIFVNVSDKPVEAELAFDAAQYGLGPGKLTEMTVTAEGETAPRPCQSKSTRKLRFEPGQAWAWVVGQ
jgi:hypothetical protein